ncbi:MAG: hypothetical protein WB661_11315 [Candidatus Bathyarchaeia archaeon]
MSDELKEWIEKELTLEDTSQILDEVKDKVKQLIRITKDGNFKTIPSGLTDKDVCYLYFVARAYSFKAGYVESDEVKNEDLKAGLKKINPPSIDTYIAEMRKDGLIEQVRTGVHTINYLRMSSGLEEISSKLGGNNVS